MPAFLLSSTMLMFGYSTPSMEEEETQHARAATAPTILDEILIFILLFIYHFEKETYLMILQTGKDSKSSGYHQSSLQKREDTKSTFTCKDYLLKPFLQS